MSNAKENMTHPSLTPKQMVEQIMFNVHTAPSKGLKLPPIMMWGQPGVGKSDIVRQVGSSLGRLVVDIRLLLKDPTDLSGIPYFNPVTKQMEYATPSELPPSMSEMEWYKTVASGLKVNEASKNPPTEREVAHIHEKIEQANDPNNTQVTLESFSDEEKSHLMYLVNEGNAIIFLDEISAAPPTVQAAALQLVLDRKVGTYQLPDGVSLIAAGNRSEDNTVHFSMPTPLRNRFSHFTIVSDYESWEEWAIDRKVHPTVVGFLKANSSKLNCFDPKARHVYAFATPRTWEFVSNVLWVLSDEKGNIQGKDNVNLLTQQVYSLIGVGTGSEFMAAFDTVGRLPDPMDILEGKIKTFNVEELPVSASYSLIVNLCHRMHEVQNRLKEENKGTQKSNGSLTDTMDKYGDNYLEFLMENMSHQEDFIVLGATIALSQYNLSISHCDKLEELLERHDDILTMI